jgi:hypothetical protein
MRRHLIGRLLVATLLGAIVLPAVVHAQAIIKVNDDVWFRFGMNIQAWGDFAQTATQNGYAENLYLRRDRFLITGSVAKDATFFFQTDDPNLGKAPKDLTGAKFVIQDAFIEYKLADAFAIDAGKMIVPLGRNQLTSVAAFLTMDISPTTTAIITPTATDAFRDTGVELKGYLFDGGRLEYRAGLYQGIREPGARNAFLEAAYVQYNFADSERGYAYQGTNLGKKTIVNVNGGYDTQNDYKAYTAGSTIDLPWGGGNEFALNFQYDNYDGGTFIPTLPKQYDLLAELGLYFSPLKLQPYGKYEKQNFSVLSANNQTRYGLGANYYVSGQNLKYSAQYLRVTPVSPIKSFNEFTVEMQVWYY